MGGGVEVPIAETVKRTGDIRGIYLDYKFKDLPDTVGKVKADFYQVSAGILFIYPAALTLEPMPAAARIGRRQSQDGNGSARS